MSHVPHVWVFLLIMYVCALHRNLVPTGAQRGHQTPSNRSCERLWATVWVLGLKVEHDYNLVITTEPSLQRCNIFKTVILDPTLWPHTHSHQHCYSRFQHKFKVDHVKIQIQKELSLPTAQEVIIIVTEIQWKSCSECSLQLVTSVILSCPGLWGNPTSKIAKDLPGTQSTSSASVTRHSINLLAQAQTESALLFVMKYMRTWLYCKYWRL